MKSFFCHHVYGKILQAGCDSTFEFDDIDQQKEQLSLVGITDRWDTFGKF